MSPKHLVRSEQIRGGGEQ
jgi:hypothetical protein